MALALAVLPARLDAVIFQPSLVAHVRGSNGERTTARLMVDTQQGRPLQITDGIPERNSPDRLPRLTRRHILIQRNSVLILVMHSV